LILAACANMGIVDPVSAQAADLRNDIVIFDDC
jgi:hypothetical protein